MILKLTNWQLDDIDILNGHGIRLPEPYDYVTITQLSAYDWFMLYVPYMQRMMRIYGLTIPQTEIADSQAEVFKFKEQLSIMLMQLNFLKDTLKFFKKIGVIKDDWKRAMKKLTPDAIVFIFLYLYLLNTDGLKKKLLCLAEKVYTTKKEQPATFTTSAAETAGGKIVDKITITNPRLRR
jgi:hypothetical protein